MDLMMVCDRLVSNHRRSMRHHSKQELLLVHQLQMPTQGYLWDSMSARRLDSPLETR